MSKIIILNRTTIFNGTGYNRDVEHIVSDSIAVAAEKRGALREPARDYIPPVETPVEVPVEPAVEVASEAEVKSKRK